MSEPDFEVLDARPEPYAVVPTLMFRLRVSVPPGELVHAMALRCQLRIEPQRRGYDTPERDDLFELFGTADQWAASCKPFLWTHVSTVVPGFTGSSTVELPVTCTYDLEVIASRYFAALDKGDIPVLLLFSGTVFWRGDDGFRVQQIPWDREARYRLPVAIWREVIDRYFPNSGWVRADRSTLAALEHFKRTHGLTSPGQALARLLEQAAEVRS